MTTKLSKISIIILILLVFTSLSFAGTDDWCEYKSTHFIIHYHPSISTAYIRAFSRKCEQYYGSIADRLGLRRFDFWTWDNRARVFVYASQENYVKDRDRPNWSAASTIPKDKLISTYCFEQDFFDLILPHELTHIIFRELIGQKAKLPLWFEEGVACANEQTGQRYLALAQEQPLPVKAMEKVTSSHALDKLSSQTVPNLPARFYATSASLVVFLQDHYGKANFQRLCQELRDGHAFYEALEKTYHIKNPQDLQAQFLTYLSHQ